MLTICGIALAVVIVALVLMVCRATAAREAAWRDMIRRRAEDAEREELFKPGDKVYHSSPFYGPGIAVPSGPADDSTKTRTVIEEP